MQDVLEHLWPLPTRSQQHPTSPVGTTKDVCRHFQAIPGKQKIPPPPIKNQKIRYLLSLFYINVILMFRLKISDQDKSEKDWTRRKHEFIYLSHFIGIISGTIQKDNSSLYKGKLGYKHDRTIYHLHKISLLIQLRAQFLTLKRETRHLLKPPSTKSKQNRMVINQIACN